MRIGISVVTHSGQNIWENGLGQNVIFLARLFQRLPFVHEVILIDVGDQGVLPCQGGVGAPDLRLMTMREATDQVDVVIEMAGALDVQWLDLMRARGKKVVFHCCGQPFASLAESSLFDGPTHSSRPDRCDEVWLLPKDAALAAFMRTLHRCDVHEVPYIWSPIFVERRMAEVAGYGLQYGFRAIDAAGLRVAIFEPNISVVKSSSIPMLICDEAYRAERTSVQVMHVLNTVHMKDHMTMLHFANALDLVREHRARFHGRHDVVGFMSQHADAVVAHQWQNDQNYGYLDVLYGNYPLVHNSVWLREAGYYYADFDAQAGAQGVRLAVARHAQSLDAYRARSHRIFAAVDPFEPGNLDAYALRLRHLFRDTASPVARRRR